MSEPLSPFDFQQPMWREIERLVAEVEQSAGASESREQFYRILIDRASLALGAANGRVWTVARGRFELTAEFDGGDLPVDALSDGPRVRDGNQPTVTPFNRHGAGQSLQLASSPIRFDSQVVAVIELVIAATGDGTSDENIRQVLAAFTASAEDFHRRHALRELKSEAAFAGRFQSFTARIHRSLQILDVAYEIANEARSMLGVDRVSVLRSEEGKCRTLAISNLPIVDRRNRTVADLERLAGASAGIATPVWHGVAGGAVPELDGPLQTYLDTSHSRVLGVVPLVASIGTPDSDAPRVCGVLVVENFSADVPNELRSQTRTLAPQAALALRNAIDHSTMPLRGLVRAAAQCRRLVDRRHLPRTLIVLGAIAAVIASLVFIPTDFTIEAEGQLEPLVARNIYAPIDGEITELRVEHDSAVTAGATLLVIRSAELDLQHRRIAGERAATQERLLAAESDRIISRASHNDTSALGSATEEELRRRLASFDEQLTIVEAQRQALELRSPIRGRVLTWEAEAMLAARPVRRGQLLLTVADVDGEWQLKLRVADHESGYVLKAARDTEQPLDVEFALATEPGVTYRGTIDRTARITSLDPTGQPVVEVSVRIQDREISDLRPGADAIAKIHCGRRSIGFVWLRDLIEFVQAKVMF